jgi:DNA anti-recombination protein RmuC
MTHMDVLLIAVPALALGFLAGVALMQARAGTALDARLTGLSEHVRAVAEANRRWDEWLLDGNRRGALAEQQAENLLRAAGLQPGLDYVRQRPLATGGQPDLTLLLPHDRVLHLDAKFPLPAFRRFTEAGTEDDRRRHRADFVRAVAVHVDDVAARGYADDRLGIGFALLYLPYDQALPLLTDARGDLDPAVDRPEVVLCSPATLRPLLALLRRAADSVTVEHSADEIVSVLEAVRHRWDEFGAAGGGMDTLGRHLVNAYNVLFGEVARRRGEITRQLATIDELRRPSSQVSELGR